MDEEENEEKPKRGKAKTKKEESSVDESEILERLEELKEELEGMSSRKFEKWCEKNDIDEVLENEGIDIDDKEEAIEYICDSFFQRAIEGDEDIPF